MANTRLTRAYGTGVTGNRNKWTISGWYKLDKGAASSGERTLFSVYSNGNYFTSLAFYDDGRINFFDYYNGGINGRVRTNALHRDVNGWYHIVGVWDKDNSTSGDKIRLWVNGVRITGSLAQYETMPSNASTLNSDDQTLEVGAMNSTSYFGGIMSHLHFCDGYAYDASYFGSTDSTTGEWKINTSPSVSYGTQGWFWLKDNIATTDNSPNSNTFTVSGGTLTKTESNPSNIFCTLNPLSKDSNLTLAAGNTTCQSDANWRSVMGTLGMSAGKYYWEAKVLSLGTINFGITMSKQDGTTHSSVDATRIMYSSNGNVYRDALGDSVSTGTTFTTNDIIGISLDCDNGILKFYKNDSLINTTTNSIITNNEWVPANGVNNAHGAMNFGNGYFNTTAVSNAGTNASGIGIFEYDVKPSDATALSTKGLNE